MGRNAVRTPDTLSENPYLIPEAADVLSVAPEPLDAEALREEVASEYPKVFYNPKVTNEQFMVAGSPYRKRFVRGRYVATNPEEEASVRAALRAYGREMADRWCGSDRSQPWDCRKCDFTTDLDQAKYDHEFYHGH